MTANQNFYIVKPVLTKVAQARPKQEPQMTLNQRKNNTSQTLVHLSVDSSLIDNDIVNALI